MPQEGQQTKVKKVNKKLGRGRARGEREREMGDCLTNEKQTG
jgi:hypothetical protein